MNPTSSRPACIIPLCNPMPGTDVDLTVLEAENLFLKLCAVSVFKDRDWNLPSGQTVPLYSADPIDWALVVM